MRNAGPVCIKAPISTIFRKFVTGSAPLTHTHSASVFSSVLLTVVLAGAETGVPNWISHLMDLYGTQEVAGSNPTERCKNFCVLISSRYRYLITLNIFFVPILKKNLCKFPQTPIILSVYQFVLQIVLRGWMPPILQKCVYPRKQQTGRFPFPFPFSFFCSHQKFGKAEVRYPQTGEGQNLSFDFDAASTHPMYRNTSLKLRRKYVQTIRTLFRSYGPTKMMYVQLSTLASVLTLPHQISG